jgi:hypothetical protein
MRQLEVVSGKVGSGEVGSGEWERIGKLVVKRKFGLINGNVGCGEWELEW